MRSLTVETPMGELDSSLSLADQSSYLVSLARLRSAAGAYMNSDVLEMDDASYDELAKVILVTEAIHPDWVQDQPLSTQVGAGTGSSGDVAHTTKMLSLDNVFSPEQLRAFLTRAEKAAGAPITDWRVEPKLDGLALSAHYENGRLVRLVTRGDGQSGEDVTSQAAAIDGLPGALSDSVTIEVRGELVLTDVAFAQANQRRVLRGEMPFANPRNAAAGSLRSAKRDPLIRFNFYAYTLLENARETFNQHAAMAYTASLGVVISAPAKLVSTPDEVVAAVDELLANRAGLGFGIDGAVIKVDDLATREIIGFTSRSPRWAIAYKYPADTRETELLGIDVGVGRTGNLSFTARLAPVSVGGVVISAASVHNPSVIASKGLALSETANQRVWVRRAGEVIPEITGASFTPDDATPYVAPSVCPRCLGPLDTSSLIWRCEKGRLCGASALISYAVSRDCLDIDSMGPAIVDQLTQRNLVSTVSDIFRLTKSDLAKLDRVGPRLAEKIITSIDEARSLPMSRVLAAMGINLTGRSMSRRLSEHFGTMSALRAASTAELSAVPGVGPVRAQSIKEEIDSLSNELDYLLAENIGQAEPASNSSDSSKTASLTGTVWVITGSMETSLSGKSRQDVSALIESLGGRVASAVTSSTTHLLKGSNPGSKAAKAQALGVNIVDEVGFSTAYL